MSPYFSPVTARLRRSRTLLRRRADSVKSIESAAPGTSCCCKLRGQFSLCGLYLLTVRARFQQGFDLLGRHWREMEF